MYYSQTRSCKSKDHCSSTIKRKCAYAKIEFAKQTFRRRPRHLALLAFTEHPNFQATLANKSNLRDQFASIKDGKSWRGPYDLIGHGVNLAGLAAKNASRFDQLKYYVEITAINEYVVKYLTNELNNLVTKSNRLTVRLSTEA